MAAAAAQFSAEAIGIVIELGRQAMAYLADFFGDY